MNNLSNESNATTSAGGVSGVPQGILVLGMHRSGTSACTRVLNLLGCALSDQLLGANDSNQAGHWEAVEAISLNDEMLASAGSSHNDWGPINSGWRESALRPLMVKRASLILSDHARLGPLFAIKDPRMCRLADVWLDAAIEAGVDPRVLLMIRNPAEVAASLEARDQMARGYAELLWLRHIVDAEFFSRGQKRVICRYDQLLGNWQGMIAKVGQSLQISFPRNTPRVNSEISQHLSASHRHHTAEHSTVVDDPNYPQLVRLTFQIMLRWSEHGESQDDYAKLDEVRAEFDRAYGTFARLLSANEFTGEVGAGGKLRGELAALQAEAESRSEALRLAAETAASQSAAAAQREAELVSQLEAAVAAAAQREAELVSQLEAAVAAAAHREAELASQLEAAVAASRLLNDENERLGGEVAALAVSADEVPVLTAEKSELTAQLANAQAVLADAQAAADAERQRRADLERDLLEASQKLQEHQLQNAGLAGQVSALQSAMTQRQEELAQLLSQLTEAERARTRAELESSQEQERRVALEQSIVSADAQIRMLEDKLKEESKSSAQRIDALAGELAKLTLLFQKEELSAQQAEEARLAAEQQALTSVAEVQRLSDQVRQLNEAASLAESARTSSERKLAARFDELARLTAIVAAESQRAEASDSETQWLRDVRRLEEGLPAWWAIMPPSWRQQRTHRRFRRAGLFDANAYLDLYPDVAEQGMDPVRHYILHGMGEGRIRPIPS